MRKENVFAAQSFFHDPTVPLRLFFCYSRHTSRKRLMHEFLSPSRAICYFPAYISAHVVFNRFAGNPSGMKMRSFSKQLNCLFPVLPPLYSLYPTYFFFTRSSCASTKSTSFHLSYLCCCCFRARVFSFCPPECIL